MRIPSVQNHHCRGLAASCSFWLPQILESQDVVLAGIEFPRVFLLLSADDRKARVSLSSTFPLSFARALLLVLFLLLWCLCDSSRGDLPSLSDFFLECCAAASYSVEWLSAN